MKQRLLDHAKRELEILNLDPAVIDQYLAAVAMFASLEIESNDTAQAISNIVSLLQFKPLSPLTDDPTEWREVGTAAKPLWQNSRDPAAFSKDGGKTYTLISEVEDSSKKAQRYHSVKTLPDIIRKLTRGNSE